MTRQLSNSKKKEVPNNTIRFFITQYDKCSDEVKRLVDEWHSTNDFGAADMIECKLEAFKKEYEQNKKLLF